jgi:hypothetical protein
MKKIVLNGSQNFKKMKTRREAKNIIFKGLRFRISRVKKN